LNELPRGYRGARKPSSSGNRSGHPLLNPMTQTIAISANAAWNILNFRLGLIRGLQEAGYDVIALAPPDAAVDRLEALGIHFVPVEMDRKGVSPMADLRLLGRYWRALRRLRPDIFLGYTVKPNIYGSLAARAHGIRVINNISGLGTAFIQRGPLTHLVSWLYRIGLAASSTVFFQNRDDQDLFIVRRLVATSRTRLLPGSGIDLDRFAPPPSGMRDGQKADFVFLMIGRVLRDKGVYEYVEAARRVLRTYPAARFQLLGFLDAENRTAVPRSEVQAWVDEGVLDYLGEAGDVRPFLAAADCVVLPSYREGLPRTLLEAAAMAKPLIATDVPGCRHIVEHETNGLLCTVRDSRSLAAAMLQMIEAPASLREKWGRAGRTKVEQEFDEKIVIQRYLQAIEDALGRSSIGGQVAAPPR
jgi:glycosyltransferase involved in cell wall biosynthesis